LLCDTNALGVSAKTAELHRASVMAKLGVRNVSDLVKLLLSYD
jgi:FixJ family two-component response regulator